MSWFRPSEAAFPSIIAGMSARGLAEGGFRMARFVFGSFIVLALAMASLPADAQQQQPRERYVSVTGEGEAQAAPDLAVIQAGVTTQAKTARQASESNSETMTKVLAALKAGGIAERDIQTSQFSIRPLRDYRKNGDNRITGFEISNRVSVKVRDIAKVETVLDQVITAGANDLSGIRFVVSERSQLLDKARGDAVADARRKAELLANAAGAKLGSATTIVENGGTPMPRQQFVARAAASAPPPIAVGEQTLRVSVSVTFELSN
jgi:uncharacterized protein YggE